VGADQVTRVRLTPEERRERARLRSERWRRAHGIGPRAGLGRARRRAAAGPERRAGQDRIFADAGPNFPGGVIVSGEKALGLALDCLKNAMRNRLFPVESRNTDNPSSGKP
jgi:hypothetical protein